MCIFNKIKLKQGTRFKLSVILYEYYIYIIIYQLLLDKIDFITVNVIYNM